MASGQPLLEVDTGYYSRKESVHIPLEALPHLRLTDHRGESIIAVAALSYLPNPFEPDRMLPFTGDRLFFLLERGKRPPKLLGPRPKQGLGVATLLGDDFVLAHPDGAFCLYEDESVNVMIEADEAARLREWAPAALATAVARLGARSRLSPLA